MNDEDPGSFSSVVSATNENLVRLTRNVAVTASAVLNGDRTSLANPSSYHRAMSGVTYRRSIVASHIKEQTPTQVLQSSLTRLSGARAPKIADELLVGLPAPRTKYSLFQNFEATTQHQEVNPEALGIRKEMATSELLEIDERIAQLKTMRKTVFERMALVEEQQASNEPTLQHFYEPGQRIKSFSAGSLPVAAVDFNSPFGKLALAVHNELQLWDLRGHDETIGEKRLLLLGRGDPIVRCVQVKGSDPTIAAGADSDVLIWNGDEDPHPEKLAGHVGNVVALDLSGHSLVTGSEDCTVRQWNAQVGRSIQTIDTFSFGITRTLQHYDNALATGSDDGIVRLWDLRMAGKAPIRILTGGHTGPVTALHFSGLQLMTGSTDGSVRTWDLRTGRIHFANAYEGAIRSLDYDSVKTVVSVANENGVRVSTRATNEHHISATGDTPVTAARYINGYLVAGRESGDVGVWAV